MVVGVEPRCGCRLLGFGGNSHQELLVSATKARLTVYNLVTDTGEPTVTTSLGH